MRMWIGVEPVELCSQHLSGEHGEIHKHRHNFVKQHSMTGRIVINALEPSSLQSRHDELEFEINRRQKLDGRKITSSPFEAPDISYLPIEEQTYKIDGALNRQLLRDRCEACRTRMETTKLGD